MKGNLEGIKSYSTPATLRGKGFVMRNTAEAHPPQCSSWEALVWGAQDRKLLGRGPCIPTPPTVREVVRT